MRKDYTELDVSVYPAPLIEDDAFDFSLFEDETIQHIGQFDNDTIELLNLDKISTAG